MRFLATERRNEVPIEEAPILLPCPFPWLRILLDVAHCELLEGRSLAGTMPVGCRIITVGGGPQSVSGFLSRFSQRQDVETTQGEPSFNAIAAIEDNPRFPAVVGHAKPEPWKRVIEIVKLLGFGRRFNRLKRAVSKLDAPAYAPLRHSKGSK